MLSKVAFTGSRYYDLDISERGASLVSLPQTVKESIVNNYTVATGANGDCPGQTAILTTVFSLFF